MNKILIMFLKSKRGNSGKNVLFLVVIIAILSLSYLYINQQDDTENEHLSGILETPTGNTVFVKSSSGVVGATTLTVTYILTASTAMTLSAATITTHANSSAVGSVTTNVASLPDLTTGDNSVVIIFTSTAGGDFIAGTYNINLSWVVVGGSNTITASTVNAS
ncbi:MAG: hypothetical protein HeimC2_37000 [Candidatus Heimdallarchaeota archaeon LC_2]|nr:MAG: hypothetical protein HeimC2_37000 [Candidatus Heimdallarchaeota archaeon LC_2]